jgi:hypothetical protein
MILLIVILIIITINVIDIGFDEAGIASEISVKNMAYVWNNFSVYEITFTIKRHPLYYSIIVICPTTLFVALNPLVFLLPVESGERIGLSMTILLSYRNGVYRNLN